MRHNARMNRVTGGDSVTNRAAARRPSAEASQGVRRAQMAQQRIQRAEARGHAVRLRQIEREKQARIRADNQAFRAQQRQQSRLARKRIADERKVALQQQRARATYARNTLGTVGRSAANTARGVGRFAAGSIGILGSFAAAGAVRNAMGAERQAAVLASKAYQTPGEKRSREQIQRDVLRQSSELGVKSGLGKEGIISGLDKFVAISGNLRAAQSLAPFLADITDATGADMSDVGRTGGQVMQAMMARGVNETAALEQTKNILASMAGQAKVGSIEFADLATQMGKVMSATAAFDGDLDDLSSTMGAISQLAIAGAASSPEEAMTAILRFRDDMVKNASRFEKQGIDVFADEGRTKLRAPEQVIADVMKATQGDLTKASNLFGIRAMKAFSPFQNIYTEAGGGDAGMQAIDDLLSRIKGASMSQGEITESASFMRQTSSKQFDRVIAEFNKSVGEELLPVVTDLIPEFTKLVPLAADAAKWLGRLVQELQRNPLQTIGKIIAAKVALDIATAGIGKAVSAALVRSVAGSSAMPGGAAGTAGTAGAAGAGAPVGGRGAGRVKGARRPAVTGGGALAAGLTALTVGTLVATTLETGLISVFHDTEDKTDSNIAELNNAATNTPEARARIRKELEDTRSTKDTLDTVFNAMDYAPLQALANVAGVDTPVDALRDFVDQTLGTQINATEDALFRAENQSGAGPGVEQWVAELGVAKDSLTGLNDALNRTKKKLDMLATAGPNRGNSPTKPST